MNSIAEKTKHVLSSFGMEWWVALISSVAAIVSTGVAYVQGTIIAYGDAESHLNIAKRVIQSITPGFAQLGGIWLPLPHVLLIPFVWSDFLWRSGLAGSIVSGLAFVVSAVYIYKTAKLLTGSPSASFLAALVFITNPNMLYMQATPMTELTLIVFFVLSSYYFIRFLEDRSNILMLVIAAFFGFCSTLARYDGWGLVLMEAGILFLVYLGSWKKQRGMIILFSTLAFFGIFLWLGWDWLILGDPLYFTHSQFSAKSQQQSWLARGELPTYQHIGTSLLYFGDTSLVNIGTWMAVLAAIGCLVFLMVRDKPGVKESAQRWLNKSYIFLLLMVPFIFNVATLYLGQSVIFIPDLTPASYQWNLFNVRYGIMMVPFAAIFIGYLFYRARWQWLKAVVLAFCIGQVAIFALGFAPVITLADGEHGLSSAIAKVPDAQTWIKNNYDHGLILFDDYSRVVSLVHSSIPMQNVIYIGNKPYWDVSLKAPETYARWIVMQRNDAVWNSIYDDPVTQARLYKYFNRVYTSEDVYIFRRIDNS